jgi:hypothetical protein
MFEMESEDQRAAIYQESIGEVRAKLVGCEVECIFGLPEITSPHPLSLQLVQHILGHFIAQKERIAIME